MLTQEQLQILSDISQSIAFAGDAHGQVNELILQGYLVRDGDIYDLTAKGVIALEEHAYLALQQRERK